MTKLDKANLEPFDEMLSCWLFLLSYPKKKKVAGYEQGILTR